MQGETVKFFRWLKHHCETHYNEANFGSGAAQAQALSLSPVPEGNSASTTPGLPPFASLPRPAALEGDKSVAKAIPDNGTEHEREEEEGGSIIASASADESELSQLTEDDTFSSSGGGRRLSDSAHLGGSVKESGAVTRTGRAPRETLSGGRPGSASRRGVSEEYHFTPGTGLHEDYSGHSLQPASISGADVRLERVRISGAGTGPLALFGEGEKEDFSDASLPGERFRATAAARDAYGSEKADAEASERMMWAEEARFYFFKGAQEARASAPPAAAAPDSLRMSPRVSLPASSSPAASGGGQAARVGAALSAGDGEADDGRMARRSGEEALGRGVAGSAAGSVKESERSEVSEERREEGEEGGASGASEGGQGSSVGASRSGSHMLRKGKGAVPMGRGGGEGG